MEGGTVIFLPQKRLRECEARSNRLYGNGSAKWKQVRETDNST